VNHLIGEFWLYSLVEDDNRDDFPNNDRVANKVHGDENISDDTTLFNKIKNVVH
jgi:hypothetical protein